MLVLLAVTLIGCATCPPLGDVPIDGGTADQRATVGQELSSLEGALALYTCVDHVRIGGFFRPDRGGSYDRLTRRVALLDELETEDLPKVLRHEVCHAVDLQNGLVKDDEESFFYAVPPDVTDHKLPNEAFADTCSLGQDTLLALWGVECAGDPDLRAAQLVSEQVWVEDEVPDPVAALEPVASIGLRDVLPKGRDPRLLGAITHLEVAQSEEPDRLVIESEWEGLALGPFEVDARTGLRLEGRTVAAEREPPEPGEVPDGWTPLVSTDDLVALGGEADGMTVTLAEVVLPTGIARRLHVRVDDGPWAPPLSPCPEPGATRFFFVDDELWTASADDHEIRWGHWARL